MDLQQFLRAKHPIPWLLCMLQHKSLELKFSEVATEFFHVICFLAEPSIRLLQGL